MRGEGKVINLRDRLAGFGGTRIDANAIEGASPSAPQAPGVCEHCGGAGTTDFIDLVAQRAKMHCQACWHCWDEEVAEPDDDNARARQAARRQDAAMRRLRH
jgi:nickel-dependent lactate racemase